MPNLSANSQLMRLLSWVPLILFLIGPSCRELPDVYSTLTPFADFEEQESTLLCWNEKHKATLLAVISAIARHEHVSLFYNENHHHKEAIEKELLQFNIDLGQISFHPFKLEKDNIWMRDYGPTFLSDENGSHAIAHFQYPHLTMPDYQQFAEQYADRMQIPIIKSEIFSAGGGREINGKGTIILVEAYEKEINPGLSKAKIEAEYRRRFNQQKVIWLKKGIPQDDFFGHGPVLDNIYGFGVSGHIDEFCRFIDSSTILLTTVDPSDLQRDPYYQLIAERMEENYRILSQATDQDGQPFRIIRVPQAPVIFANARLRNEDIIYTPVTSYLNFIITNKSVIIPSYYREGAPDYVREKDEQVKEVFRKAFPTREIHAVDPIELNHDGGGLHCIALSKPSARKRLQQQLKKPVM